MQAMKEQMEVMMNAFKGRVSSDLDDLVNRTNSPFTAPVNSFPLLSKSRMPQTDSYDEIRDPLDPLETFKTLMHLQGVVDVINLVQPVDTQLHQHLQGAKRSIYYALHQRTSVQEVYDLLDKYQAARG